jgi:O-antigen/teichoic acid export membrane protein
MANSLKRAALNGVMWSLVQAWGARALTLLHFVVIARLLDPADLGLIAFATALVACFATVVDHGMGPYLESHAQASPTELDTGWWSATLTGLGVSLLIAGAAPWLAQAAGKPYLAQLLPVLGATVLISALSSTQVAVLKARFLHKQLALATLLSTVLGTVVGITAAWQGAAYWALVLKALVEAVVLSAYLVACSPWRPGLSWRRGDWQRLAGQGWPVLGMRVLDIANQRLDVLLVGSRLGSVALGYYATGQRIYQIAMEALFSAVNQVALPVFGRVSAEPTQAGALLLRIVRLSSLLTMPAFALAAACGPAIVALVFGERWLAAGPVFSVFCIGGVLFSVSYFNAPLLMACGRNRAVLGLTVLNAVTNALAFWFAVPYGPTAVAAAFVLRGYLVYPVNLAVVRQATGVTLRAYAQALAPALVCSALAAGASLGSQWLLPTSNAALGTLLALSAGAAVYGLGLITLFPSALRAARHEVRSLRAPPEAALA